jgi:CubicO group peptidase (beta-lactamase class C family)
MTRPAELPFPMITRRPGFLAIALLVQSAAAASAVTTADVDAVVRAELATTWSPGCALAVVKGGQVLHSAGYGLASIEHQAPVKPSTVFPIGSVTKHFTAVLTLLLVDEGKLTLEDPLFKWLAGIPEEWKPVTIRQLLSHQSGITAYTADKEFRKSACREFDAAEILAFASNKPMRFAPGSQYGYSNTNHFLLGLVIEKISGKRYCEVVAERLCVPLGMTSTRCANPSAIIPGIADGYTGASLEVARHAERVSASHAGGSGALVSTIEDMVKWDAALQGGKVLRPERVRQLETITTTSDGTQTPHGLGWVVEEPGSHRALVQTGSLPGFNAAIMRLPDDDLFVVAMVNSDMVSAGHLAMQVAALWFPTMVAATAPLVDPDPALTARLKAIILSLPAGTVSREEFTPEAAAQLFAGAVEQAGTFLSGLGSLQSIAVVDRRPLEGGLVQCRTKLSYEKLDLAATWALNADGKIAGLTLGPL